MLLSLILAVLLGAAPVAPAPAPRIEVEHAGFLRDVRATLDERSHLSLQAKLQLPAVVSRRTFTIEALSLDGQVLFRETATASARPAGARHKHPVELALELTLPELSGVVLLRVRLAR